MKKAKKGRQAKQEPVAELVALQRQANGILASLDEHLSELAPGDDAQLAPGPLTIGADPGDSIQRDMETVIAWERIRSELAELRAEIAAVLIAQNRTNELLELAFRAAFDREERGTRV